ncbi:MAG TPA: response regulator, partial [Spirochaetota bacterium]|nr:response regulator [Spirochaetota bacterium]
ARETGDPFDLVIMDLTVPGKMGGLEAVKKLREIDSGIRAIVSSGYSNDPILSDFGRYGFSGVIVKPFRVEDLGLALKKILH